MKELHFNDLWHKLQSNMDLRQKSRQKGEYEQGEIAAYKDVMDWLRCYSQSGHVVRANESETKL